MYKISIIIPLYNGKEKIEKCLKSIFSQSLPALQVIIIDDGSTDDTYRFLKEWLSKNDTKDYDVIIKSKENSGVANTRNQGIDMAEGKYIMFADQDDFFDSDYCEAFLDAIEKNDGDIVVGGYERVKSSGDVMLSISLKDEEWSKYVVMSPWAHIYRTSYIKENSIRFLPSSIGEDVFFNMCAYSHTDRISSIDYKGYKWFYNDESVSNSRQNTINEKVNPLILLDSLIKEINKEPFGRSVYTEYFFARYICWYMLFSSRGSKRADIENAFNALHGWLISNYPDAMKNPYIGMKMPEGEIKSTHRFVFIYYLLYRIGILKSVLKLFGK